MRWTLALLLAAACGKTPAKAPPAGGALLVSAADGLDLRGGKLQGFVRFSRGESPVTGARLTIEGVALPEAQPGDYDASAISAAPGAALHLLAIDGDETASVAFTCPTPPSITAPADQAQVTAGGDLQVSWTGRINYNAGAHAAQLLLKDSAGAVKATVALASNQTSASISVAASGAYTLDLSVPGELAAQPTTSGEALCIAHAALHLTAQ